jgi:nitroreductase
MGKIDERREQVLELLAGHRSIRAFKDAPLPEADVERAVRAAQQAATSSHIQAYSLLRLRDPSVRARLVELTGGQPYVAGCGAFFAVLADQRRHKLLSARHDAAHVDNLETFLLAVVDASLFAQNLVIAFEAMGYGTCYIGGLRNRLPEVVELLELPEGALPLFGLCVGVPDQQPETKPRLPVEAICFEDRYPQDAELLERIDAYDEVMERYYERRGKVGHNWSGAIWRRYAKPHREHLAECYRGLGARLD